MPQQTSFLDHDTGLTPEAQAEQAKTLAKTHGPVTSKIAARSFVQNGSLDSQQEIITWLSDQYGKEWTTHELAIDSEKKLAKKMQLTSVQINRRTPGLLSKDVLIQLGDRDCECCGRPMHSYESKRV